MNSLQRFLIAFVLIIHQMLGSMIFAQEVSGEIGEEIPLLQVDQAGISSGSEIGGETNSGNTLVIDPEIAIASGVIEEISGTEAIIVNTTITGSIGTDVLLGTGEVSSENLVSTHHIESNAEAVFITDPSEFLPYVGTTILANADNNQVSFSVPYIFSSPVGNIQAYIQPGTIIATSDKNPFNLRGFGIGEGSNQLTRKVEVIDSEGNVIIKDEVKDGFHFGVDGQHLLFSKPVQLSMGTALEDGTEVEISVKHEGDMNFNTQGLSVDPRANCLSDGSTDRPGNKVVVASGSIVFYTCGASVFSVSYVGGANFANFAEASIAPGYVDKIVNFAVGSPFPAGSLIKDLNVTIDFRPIDTENPASFSTTNCYPTEKYFRLTSPVGTAVNIITAGSLTTPNLSCPRVNLVFDDEAAAGLGGNYNRASGSSWQPAALLSAFDNQSPFGNRTLRMGDNAFADGVILFGFTVTIETYDPPLCIFSPNQVTVPQFQVKNVDQTYEYQFDNWTVQDPRGYNSGYYTTLQMGNLNGPNAQSIPNSQIQRKADPVTLVNGTANPLVVLGSAMGVYHLATATDTFIKRDTAPNSNRTGTYGSKLWINVTIPAYTRPGSYSGNITYTLYENP